MYDLDGLTFDATQYKELLELDFYLLDKFWFLLIDYYDPYLM